MKDVGSRAVRHYDPPFLVRHWTKVQRHRRSPNTVERRESPIIAALPAVPRPRSTIGRRPVGPACRQRSGRSERSDRRNNVFIFQWIRPLSNCRPSLHPLGFDSTQRRPPSRFSSTDVPPTPVSRGCSTHAMAISVRVSPVIACPPSIDFGRVRLRSVARADGALRFRAIHLQSAVSGSLRLREPIDASTSHVRFCSVIHATSS
jgi:hypothetical protein